MATAAPPTRAADPSRPLAALAERVQQAIDELPEAPALVLELRERRGLDHAAIAEKIGAGTDDVAGLLVVARLRIREAVRGGPAPPPESEDCLRARADLTRIVDGEAPADREWTRDHASACESCAAARLAMREATLAARVWAGAPVAAPADVPDEDRNYSGLRQEPPAIAVDPSVPPAAAPLGPARTAPRRGHRAAGAAKRAARGVPAKPATVASAATAELLKPPARPQPRRLAPPRATALIALAGILIVAVVALAVLTSGDSTAPSSARESTLEPVVAPSAAPSDAAATPAKKASKPSARKRKRKRPAKPKAATPVTTPQATATPQATPTPGAGTEQKKKKKTSRRPATTQPGDDTGTDVGSGTGGLGQPGQQEGSGAPPGTQTPISDPCAEDSPDCESG